jgi:hypothetical protein
MDNINDESMSTNIDDLIDPVLLNSNKEEVNSKSLNLKQKDENTSNVKINIEKKSDSNDIFNEHNILLLFILLLAGLPQSNNIITSLIPLKNDILTNIVKAIVLFIIYYVVVHYVLS